MRNNLLILGFIIFLTGCLNQDAHRNVGDIPFDASLDKGSFSICNEGRIKQYYARNSMDTPAGYKGEKKALVQTILDAYSFPKKEREQGYLTIRFVINCEGATGRFRIEEMDFKYKPSQFDKGISEQLLNIVKGLDGWIPRSANGKRYDVYQYLTFKIEAGQITEILP
jgi:hypothetical protein